MDHFCWQCHEFTTELQRTRCRICGRPFHTRCWSSQRPRPSSSDTSCIECEAVTLEFTNPTNVLSRVGPTKLQKFYLYMLEFVQENLALEKAGPFAKNTAMNAHSASDEAISPMVLDRLRQWIRSGRYDTYAQFLADLRGLAHASAVAHGAESGYKRIATYIVETCKQLCNSLDWCPECFERCIPQNGESFSASAAKAMVHPCSKLHQIVCIRIQHRLWPAILYKHVGGFVNVRFFGTLEFGRVPSSSVVLLSQNFHNKPSEEIIAEGSTAYANAMQQCQSHIKRLLATSCLVDFSPPNTAYDGRLFMPTSVIKGVEKTLKITITNPDLRLTSPEPFVPTNIKRASAEVTLNPSSSFVDDMNKISPDGSITDFISAQHSNVIKTSFPAKCFENSKLASTAESGFSRKYRETSQKDERKCENLSAHQLYGPLSIAGCLESRDGYPSAHPPWGFSARIRNAPYVVGARYSLTRSNHTSTQKQKSVEKATVKPRIPPKNFAAAAERMSSGQPLVHVTEEKLDCFNSEELRDTNGKQSRRFLNHTDRHSEWIQTKASDCPNYSAIPCAKADRNREESPLRLRPFSTTSPNSDVYCGNGLPLAASTSCLQPRTTAWTDDFLRGSMDGRQAVPLLTKTISGTTDIEKQLRQFVETISRLSELRRLEKQKIRKSFEAAHATAMKNFLDAQDDADQIFHQELMANQQALPTILELCGKILRRTER